MRKLAVLIPTSVFVAALLSGCGVDSSAIGTSTQGALGISGHVFGGQQPVYKTSMQLYTAGKTGNGSAATAMISKVVQTDANGYFNITGDYTCANSTDQVYMVAYGGQAIPGTNNSSLVMMDALGNCGNLSDSSYITINEITTVGAVYALAPFMQVSTSGSPAYANVGGSATNKQGLANAFLDAQLIADPGTGKIATIGSNLTIQSGKVNALADVLAACINSDGMTACAPLYTAATPAGGSAPTDVLSAAIDIVKNPAQNAANIFYLINSTPPYPTTLTAPPTDWTLTLTVTGGGLSSPTALDIDNKGNVWVAGYYGILNEFTPQGSPVSATGYGSGVLNENYGMTIDSSGNIWVANEESPSENSHGTVSKFLGASSGSPGTLVMNGGYTQFWDSSIDFPVSLSADTNGDIFIANYADSTATVYNSSGSPVASGFGSGYAAFPVAAAADSNHGVWLANLGNSTVTHIDQNGNLLSNANCCDGANGIAVDALGNAWVANYYGNSFSEVSASGTVLINDQAIVGSNYYSYPAGISVDAGQNVWIANYRGESISEISGALSAVPGTVLSPSAGFGYSGPPPATPTLLLPYDVIPDESGNVWVSNFGDNNLIMFFGLATPTVTPTQPVPTAP